MHQFNVLTVIPGLIPRHSFRGVTTFDLVASHSIAASAAPAVHIGKIGMWICRPPLRLICFAISTANLPQDQICTIEDLRRCTVALWNSWANAVVGVKNRWPGRVSAANWRIFQLFCNFMHAIFSVAAYPLKQLLAGFFYIEKTNKPSFNCVFSNLSYKLTL